MANASRLALGFLIFGSCGLVACGPSTAEPQPASSSVTEAESRLAALGVATLTCRGTVGPDSYVLSDGIMKRGFDGCTSGDAAQLAEIDELLAVQFVPEARLLADAMVHTWQSWLQRFPSDIVEHCPTWERIGTTRAATLDEVARHPMGSVGESLVEYRIVPDATRSALAVSDAVDCAAGFGKAFVVSSDEQRGRIVADPVWWLSNDDFPQPEQNPFLSPGYFHAMSYYGAAPGAVYGSSHRAGEACSMYYGGYHYKVKLVPVYCDADWICMTQCRGAI